MHALIPILTTTTMANKDQKQHQGGGGDGGGDHSSSSSSSSSSASKQQQQQQQRLKALEAKAVAEATATADAAYTPSASLLNAPDPEPLLKQVDGPSLAEYYEEGSAAGKESVYVGRSVPIAAGGSLVIPIQVSSPGSVVEYAVENKQYDFGFGITAEREEGITIVKVSLHFFAFFILCSSPVHAFRFSYG
jgi:hypothetical protein